MSDFGRFWALKIRGCTIAEHAITLRLGDRHNAKTGLCYPGRESLTFELECSRNYLTQCFQSLEMKKFIERKKRCDPMRPKVQIGIYFNLNFYRWFPFHSTDVEHEEKRLLGYFRRAVESPELAKGLHSVWLEKPFYARKEETKKPRNDFRKQGRNVHTKRPVSTTLWIAVTSAAHEEDLKKKLPEILDEIENDTGHRFLVRTLRIWIKSSD